MILGAIPNFWIQAYLIVVVTGVEIGAISVTRNNIICKVSQTGLEVPHYHNTGLQVTSFFSLLLLFPIMVMTYSRPKQFKHIAWESIEGVSISKWQGFKKGTLRIRETASDKVEAHPFNANLLKSKKFRAAVFELAPEGNPLREFLSNGTEKSDE